jgi:hypothetical protein
MQCRLPHTTGSEAEETNAMNNQPIASKQSTKPLQNETATYFGLTVEVIACMSNCSLIRYRNRQFVVETADLRKSLAVGRAA